MDVFASFCAMNFFNDPFKSVDWTTMLVWYKFNYNMKKKKKQNQWTIERISICQWNLWIALNLFHIAIIEYTRLQHNSRSQQFHYWNITREPFQQKNYFKNVHFSIFNWFICSIETSFVFFLLFLFKEHFCLLRSIRWKMWRFCYRATHFSFFVFSIPPIRSNCFFFVFVSVFIFIFSFCFSLILFEWMEYAFGLARKTIHFRKWMPCHLNTKTKWLLQMNRSYTCCWCQWRSLNAR